MLLIIGRTLKSNSILFFDHVICTHRYSTMNTLTKLSNWLWGTSEPPKIIEGYRCGCRYCKHCKIMLRLKKK